MLRLSGLLLTAFLFACGLTITSRAQDIGEGKAQVSPTPSSDIETGLVLTRLSQKELEKFSAIAQVVFAQDENFQPLHPTLRALWEWVETSGHAVFVELTRSDRTVTCSAGSFTIERFDPSHQRHEAVLRLDLAVIDLAVVAPHVARPNGFVPFDALNRWERYAEVLGHELAHAVYILTNEKRAQAVEELIERTNELLLYGPWRGKKTALPVTMKQRMKQRDLLLRDLESQAEAMEEVVWRELKAGQPLRARLRSHPPNGVAEIKREESKR